MNFLQCVTILYLHNAKNTIKIVTNMRNRINQLLNSPEWNALLMPIISNPWDNFLNTIHRDLTTPKYLEGDKKFIDAYQKYLDAETRPTSSKKNPKDDKWLEANKLHLELIPEPFEGNPEAPIYLLGGNPGYGEEGNEWHIKEDYLDIMSETLSHKYRANQDNNPTDFAFFDKRLDGYGGTKWWKGHIADKIKDKIFNIEFFAYHSTKADGLKGFFSQIAKQPNLPTCISNQYADQLIYRAIENKKIIIITRFEKYWLERIKNFEEYDNLYILLNHQIAIVKGGNIIEYKKYKDLKSDSWSDLLNKVKP